MKINDTKQTVYSNKSPTIADEDTAMDIIESIDFVNEENIDHESSQFSFSFSAETARLVQENDIIGDTDDDTDSESSSILDGDSDDDEMPNNEDDMYQLWAIAPDTNVVAAATETVSVQPQKNKVTKPLPKNRRGKYTYHSPDIMKQALVLKAAGRSYRKISTLMNISRDYQHNCVFVNEASVMANMRRNYAWSAAGEVAHVKVPQMLYTRSSLRMQAHLGTKFSLLVLFLQILQNFCTIR
ncbi:hypothetical protein INT45_002989 [Circinella minor]|uniref:Transposase n=1 Tax=Circinella minor TaxID=1195481 RepID=A0A8H7RQB9_9FUNG|nr:hypothetical protein INT45_002989 [Circinella minor]